MAAGVSLRPERLALFQRELQLLVRDQVGDGFPVPSLVIDGVIDLEQTSLDLVDEISGLSPFGPGNRALTFASRGVTIKRVTNIGRSQDHRKLLVAGRTGETRSVLWWKSGSNPLPECQIDLAYQISAHDYRGKRSLQLEWIDARQADIPRVAIVGVDSPSVVDHRSEDADDSLAKIIAGLAEPPLIWGEHDVAGSATGRDQIIPAQTLVIWTTPPGRHELQQVLGRANPRELHLFAVDPTIIRAEQFISSLAGLCKQSMRHHKGRIALGRLAAATAHREETVRAGLAWLAAKGDLTVVQEDENAVTLGGGITVDQEASIRAEAAVRELLAETSAYRGFFATAPIEALIRTL